MGFHEGRANAFLEEHVGTLGEGRRVLVPLCGKAEDLAFLASRGHDVVGIELVEDAVRAFFDERGVVPEVSGDARVRRYRAGRVTILAADLFACTRADVGDVDAFYDRAAIVALPPEPRRRYVHALRSLLAPAARGLVITFEYDPSAMDGPPFSVGEAELRDLYAGATVERLPPDVGREVTTGRLAEAGGAREHVFSIVLPTN